MYGWRGRIGYVAPAAFRHSHLYSRLLPEGVTMHVMTLGLERVNPEECERVFGMYLPAARRLAQDKVDVMMLTGTPIFNYIGYDRSLELSRNIEKAIGIPAITTIEAAFQALDALSAKKLIFVSPYEEARNVERKKLCETLGYQVVNIKGLGFQQPGAEFASVPPYVAFRAAKQAFLETPDCDAIWISCPGLPGVLENIERLESDTGKPVLAGIASMVWWMLRTMHIREPIKGHGRLLQLL